MIYIPAWYNERGRQIQLSCSYSLYTYLTFLIARTFHLIVTHKHILMWYNTVRAGTGKQGWVAPEKSVVGHPREPEMTAELVRAEKGIVLPAIIAGEGHRASRRFLEFFTANIRNPNTRL